MDLQEKKGLYRAYERRWKLVEEVEKAELRDASFETLLLQTFAIWDIRHTLGFSDNTVPSPHIWSHLQKQWKNAHA